MLLFKSISTPYMRIWLLVLFSFLSVCANAQIIRGEYFFDTDPGIGKGIVFDINDEDFLDNEFTFSTEGLEPGIHLLGFRLRNDDHWGFVETLEIHVEDQNPSLDELGIIAGEYYFDTDPGIGKGIPFEVSRVKFLDDEFNFDIPEDLGVGEHTLGVRLKGDEGLYGFSRVLNFEVVPENGIEGVFLKSVEYVIFDEMQVEVKRETILLNETQNVLDEEFLINTDGLAPGEYELAVSSKSGENVSGPVRTLTFMVVDGTAPVSLSLSNQEVIEGEPVGTEIGVFTTDDNDTDDTHTYSLVSGEGDDDNTSFTIDGDELKASEVFDFATKSSYSIRVRSTDLGELFTEQAFTITVINEKEDQIITFTEIGIDTYGETETLIATASSGLDVTFESSDPAIATATGNVLKFIGVGEVIISAIQAGDDTYGAEEVMQTIQVSKASLTVVADDKTKVYGADNPELTIAYSGFVNGDDENSLVAEPDLSTEASAASGVGVYDISLSGGTSDNYEFGLMNGQLTVTKAPLLVIAEDQSRVYGADNPEFTTSYTGFVNEDDINSLTQLPEITTSALVTSDAGDYDITLSGGASDNYALSFTNGLLTVTKAALSATADDQSRSYGAANPAFTITYSGFVNGDDENSLTAAPVITTTATATSNVGSYDLALSGGTSTNYDLSLTSGQLSITQAALVAQADDQSRAYGAVNPVLSISYSGFVNGEDVAVLTDSPVATTTASAASSPGSYEITLSGGQDDNYALSLSNGELVVTKAMLTVTADNKERVYGAANPELIFSYTGFVNGEDENDLASPPEIGTTATSASDVGSYAITLTSAEDNNYAYTFVEAVLSVTKAVLIAEANDATKNKGEDNPDFTITYSGFVNGDAVTDLDALPTISTSATSESDRGAYDIVPSGGADNNYSFDLRNGTLTVTGPVFTLPTSIDFGQVDSGESATESVAIQNTGDGVLEVSAISMPPGFTVDETAFNLAVSESTTLTITFSPTEGKVYNGNLVLSSNDGTSLIALTGEGMLVTGLDDEILDEEEVKTYPNPATNELTIDLTAGPAGPVDLSLIDPKGQERLSLSDVRERKVTLDVSSYRMGIYILKIESRKGTVFRKVMVER